MDKTIGDELREQRDGLHDIVMDPAFQSAVTSAVETFLGALFEPDLLERIRRLCSVGDRNDARSFSVGIGDAGRVRILEREPSRIDAVIYNLGSAVVYVGGRQVTVGGPNDASGGVPIQPGTGLIRDKNIGELYAISASAAQDVRVLENNGGI